MTNTYNPQETKAKQDCLELWSRITLLPIETIDKCDEPDDIKELVLEKMGLDYVFCACPLCNYYRTEENPMYKWRYSATIMNGNDEEIPDYYTVCSGCPICQDVKTKFERIHLTSDQPPCYFTAYTAWRNNPTIGNATAFYEYLKTIMANHDNMWKVVNNKEFDRAPHYFKTEEEAREFMHREGISDKIGAGNGPYHVDDIPTLKKDGYEYGFWGKRERCPDCGAEMLGRVKSYPPYCDSTYEEWSCPECGKGWGAAV